MSEETEEQRKAREEKERLAKEAEKEKTTQATIPKALDSIIDSQSMVLQSLEDQAEKLREQKEKLEEIIKMLSW